jgi:hypothetical protein
MDIGGGCVLSVTRATFGDDSRQPQAEIPVPQLQNNTPFSDGELRILLPSDCLTSSTALPLAVVWNLYDPRDPDMGAEFLSDLEVSPLIYLPSLTPLSD